MKKHYLVDDGEVQKRIAAGSRRAAAKRYAASMNPGFALVAAQEVNRQGEEVGSFEWFPMQA